MNILESFNSKIIELPQIEKILEQLYVRQNDLEKQKEKFMKRPAYYTFQEKQKQRLHYQTLQKSLENALQKTETLFEDFETYTKELKKFKEEIEKEAHVKKQKEQIEIIQQTLESIQDSSIDRMEAVRNLIPINRMIYELDQTEIVKELKQKYKTYLHNFKTYFIKEFHNYYNITHNHLFFKEMDQDFNQALVGLDLMETEWKHLWRTLSKTILFPIISGSLILEKEHENRLEFSTTTLQQITFQKTILDFIQIITYVSKSWTQFISLLQKYESRTQLEKAIIFLFEHNLSNDYENNYQWLKTQLESNQLSFLLQDYDLSKFIQKTQRNMILFEGKNILISKNQQSKLVTYNSLSKEEESNLLQSLQIDGLNYECITGFPICRISQKTFQYWEFIKKNLDCSELLLQLYISLQLNLPALLLHNDHQYSAHQCLLLYNKNNEDYLLDYSLKFQKLSNQILNNFLNQHLENWKLVFEKNLHQTIRGSHLKQKHDQIYQNLKQVLQNIQSSLKQWKPLLPPFFYLMCASSTTGELLLWFLEWIEDIGDIEVDESYHLYILFLLKDNQEEGLGFYETLKNLLFEEFKVFYLKTKAFHSNSDQESADDIQKEFEKILPNSFEYAQLHLSLLQMSLAEITESVRKGIYDKVGLKKNTLISMIKCLFTDSPNRLQLIAEIEN